MEWFRATGDFGPLIVAVAAAHVIASVVAARIRSPRRVAVGLLITGASPALVGIVGMLRWSVWMSRTTDTLRAPTPKDLAGGIYSGLCCVELGAAASAVALIAAAVVYVRSPRPEVPPPPGPET
jgi:hypothetical protein